MNDHASPLLPRSRGNARRPLKITVVRTTCINDFFDQTPEGARTPAAPVCQKFRTGQSFIVTDPGGKPPADFPCAWAWHDLFQVILGLQLGGNYEQFENGVFYASCTDGLHPVFFRLERLT